MPVHLIIVGYNPNNRLIGHIPPDVLAKGACDSPGCHIGSVFRVFEMPQAELNAISALQSPSMLTQQGSSFVLMENAAPEIKPAETYVLKFDDRAAAVAFLEGVAPRERLAGKLILLIDPSKQAQPPGSADKGLAALESKTTAKKVAKKAAAPAKRAAAKKTGNP